MRTLFPTRTVALHAQLNAASLPDRCQVERPQSVDDGEGGQLVTWVADAPSLPCRLSPVGTPVERVRADQIQALARWTVVFGAEVVVSAPARLRVTTADGAEVLLDPHGDNGPRAFEAQRKHECSLWRGPDGQSEPGS